MPLAPALARRRGRRINRRRAPAWLYPRHLEREYEAWLVENVAALFRDSVTRHLLGALPGLVAQAGSLRPDQGGRMDAWPDDVTRLIAVIAKDMEPAGGKSRGKALSLGIRLSEQNRGEWGKILQAIGGANPFTAEPWLRPHLEAFASQNVALITSLSAESVGKVEGIALRGLTGGLRVEEIADQIQSQFDTTEARARLIARDQTAKLNGQFTELRQKDAGIERYIWRTAHDERVRGNPGGKYPDARPSHWVMEGLECSWSDPTIYFDSKGRTRKRSGIGGPDEHPGQPIQDRCYAEPILPSWMEAA